MQLITTNLSLVHSKKVDVDFLNNVSALQFHSENGMELRKVL